MGDEWWTTRQAAAHLGLSLTAMWSKTMMLGAEKNDRKHWRWPADKVREYGRLVADMAPTDPTRGSVFEDLE